MAETVQQRVAEVLGAHWLWRDDACGFNFGTRCGGRACIGLRFANDAEGADHQAQMLADAGLLDTPVEPGMPPRSAQRAPVATDGRDEGREGL